MLALDGMCKYYVIDDIVSLSCMQCMSAFCTRLKAFIPDTLFCLYRHVYCCCYFRIYSLFTYYIIYNKQVVCSSLRRVLLVTKYKARKCIYVVIYRNITQLQCCKLTSCICDLSIFRQ